MGFIGHFVFDFFLDFGVVVVLLFGVRIKLLLEFLCRQRRVYGLDELSVIWVNQVGIKLDDPVEDILLTMALQVLDVPDEVFCKKVDFVSVPMYFLCEGDAPHHGVNAFVGVVLGDF